MMRASRILRWSVVTVLSLAASACVNLNKSYPEKRSFVLDVPAEQRAAAQDARTVLKINKLRVAPLSAGRAMVYRTGDVQYENDFYNEWFAAPGVLVTQQLQDWLARSGRYQLVLTGTSQVEPGQILEGTITEFHGDFRQREAPRAVLALDLHLLDGQREGRLLFHRLYHQEVPLQDRSPVALAQGLSQGLRAILGDLEQDLSALAVTPTASPAFR
jgi:uncharacterized lipoprotein YmbA